MNKKIHNVRQKYTRMHEMYIIKEIKRHKKIKIHC